MKHVWKGHCVDSEIGNVSARQAALNRWTATDKRWKRKTVSRGPVVTSDKRLPICARNSWALALTGHSFIYLLFNPTEGTTQNEERERQICTIYRQRKTGRNTQYRYTYSSGSLISISSRPIHRLGLSLKNMSFNTCPSMAAFFRIFTSSKG